jgi:hypothetical protein
MPGLTDQELAQIRERLGLVVFYGDNASLRGDDVHALFTEIDHLRQLKTTLLAENHRLQDRVGEAEQRVWEAEMAQAKGRHARPEDDS